MNMLFEVQDKRKYGRLILSQSLNKIQMSTRIGYFV